MPRRLTIVQGHPDPAGNRLCHALADAYATGAEAAGHEVRRAMPTFPIARGRARAEINSESASIWKYSRPQAKGNNAIFVADIQRRRPSRDARVDCPAAEGAAPGHR
jgi:Flavodoxin-like fold